MQGGVSILAGESATRLVVQARSPFRVIAMQPEAYHILPAVVDRG